MLKQRKGRQDWEQPRAIMQYHVTQLAALAAIQPFAEIALNMHQHIGVVFLEAVFSGSPSAYRGRRRKGIQVLPLMHRRDERANFAIAGLMMRQ